MNLNVKDLVVVIGEGQLKNLLSKYLCIPGCVWIFMLVLLSLMMIGLFFPRKLVVP